MKILLTNDDGFDAPGLSTLRQVLETMGDVISVAPEVAVSGISHKLTVHTPLEVREIDDTTFAVSGTPADCTRVGLEILPDADFVVSGINMGANLGTDVYASGTVAAAREAGFLGKKAIAFSQYFAPPYEFNWPVTEKLAGFILPELLSAAWEPGMFYNVNFPDTKPYAQADPPVAFCPVDTSSYAYRFKKDNGTWHFISDIHSRPRIPDGDIALCLSGHLTVSRVLLNPSAPAWENTGK